MLMLRTWMLGSIPHDGPPARCMPSAAGWTGAGGCRVFDAPITQRGLLQLRQYATPRMVRDLHSCGSNSVQHVSVLEPERNPEPTLVVPMPLRHVHINMRHCCAYTCHDTTYAFGES